MPSFPVLILLPVLFLRFAFVYAQDGEEVIGGETVDTVYGNGQSTSIEEVIGGATADTIDGNERSTPDDYKNEDDCDDHCEDRCEDECKKSCNGKSRCEEKCDDDCDESCDKTCGELKPVYGTVKKSVLCSIHFDYMGHTSAISNEENRFVDEMGMYVVYVLEDSSLDTVDVDYSYSTFCGGLSLLYFVSNRIGIGILYEYSIADQSFSNTYESTTENLIENHTIACAFRSIIWQRPRVGISIATNIGATFGSLHRFPVLNAHSKDENMPEDDVAFYREVNMQVDIMGFTGSLAANFNYMINRYLVISGGPVYKYSYISLQNDRLIGYMKSAGCNEFGINFNFGVLFGGLNTVVKNWHK